MLFAARTSDPTIILEAVPRCKCTLSEPCFANNDNVTVDSTAFYSHASNALVRLSNVIQSSPTPVFGIINYDPAPFRNETGAILEGIIYVRLVTDGNGSCPVYPVNGTSSAVYELCGNGVCENGQCNCEQEGQPEYYGRMCQLQLFPWTSDDPPPHFQNDTPPFAVNSTYNINDTDESPGNIELSIPVFQTAVVKIPLPPENEFRYVAFVVAANASYGISNITNLMRLTVPQSPGSTSEICAANIDSMGRPDSETWIPDLLLSSDGTSYDVAVAVREVDDDTEVYLSIFAAPGDQVDYGNMVFKVFVVYCETENCPPQEYFNIIPVELIPIVFVLLLLAIGVMILLLCFDRQHGFTEQNAKLSITELNRMYPVTHFHKEETRVNLTPRNNATTENNPGNGESAPGPVANRIVEDDTEKECPICLCNFEEREEMRVLQCGHEFHTECIDVSCLSVPPQLYSFRHSNNPMFYTVPTSTMQPCIFIR